MDDLYSSRSTFSEGSGPLGNMAMGATLLPAEPASPYQRQRQPLALVLLVGDRQDLASPVGGVLQRMGYTVEHVSSGTDALRRMVETHARPRPEAVALGTQLPDMAGFEFCQRLRAADLQAGQPAVLMFSEHDDTFDRIVGLESGADDFLAMPFHPREMLARLQGVLRRRLQQGRPAGQEETSGSAPLRFGSLEIDARRRCATLAGRELPLTSYRFSLLLVLAERAGQALTRDQIISATTGWKHEHAGRGLDVQIGRIRAAIEQVPHRPRRIVTVRGTGYMFARAQD